jgi:predicted TIM-barrel enzyme
MDRKQILVQRPVPDYILTHTHGIVGFFGASSIERLPTEVAITSCVKGFKQIAP